MSARLSIPFFLFLVLAAPAAGSTLSGIVTDPSNAALPGSRVVLRELATGRERVVLTDQAGRFQLDAPETGRYLLIVSRAGFDELARPVAFDRPDQTLEIPIQLAIGVLKAELHVTATRAQREVRNIPLHVETISGEAIAQRNALSTGDALSQVASITPVGSGPFNVRPRLRGLDSTRLLVLVDGERLNTARQATDRTGAEVGLIATDAVERIEVVGGAGTLLYGSDALAGTINVLTNEPAFSQARRFLYGASGFYSSNEEGLRGSVTLGVTAPRYALRVQGGAERFENYTSGALGVEDTRPFFADGRLRRGDTIDDTFGFAFAAFPDPFNAPYVRDNEEVPNSQARGNFVNASALVGLGRQRTLRLRYQRRDMRDIGLPDFAQPYFFNQTSVPHSRFDRVSARYDMPALTSWLANLSFSAYYQGTERLLRNTLPVQFPAPAAATFFPISVMRLDVRSETEQRVWTPGASIQATLTPAAGHVLTAGVTVYRDRSSDRRTTVTTTSMVGQVVMGARGPAAVVLPAAVPLGAPVVAQPVRVPNASLTDVGVFAQDEWRVAPRWSLVGGIRGDLYAVDTDATPGYDVASVVRGAVPAVDPATLPNAGGASYTRRALTGDLALVANPDGRINPFVRVGRSYRHPNLEEMLFAGPATVGSIAPNVTVKPETGTNVDVGAKLRSGALSAGAYLFVNRYRNFIAQDVIVATTPSRTPLAQTLNYADVRISGIELTADGPIRLPYGVLTLAGSGAFTHGTVGEGNNRSITGNIPGGAADHITPRKLVASARFTEPRGRWWAEYGVRTQGDVRRVAPTLLESPFLIAQDLLSLDGFTVHRLGGGFGLTGAARRVNISIAVENLTNQYYREHFQFAPARGRSFTIGFGIGAF